MSGHTRVMPELPADPMSAMAESAATLHELYMSYLKAGFDKNQSLTLCLAVVTAHITPPCP